MHFFSTDSRYTYWYQLCFSSCRLVPLFIQGRLHKATSQENRKSKGSCPDHLISHSTISMMSFHTKDKSASYLDLHLEIDKMDRIRTKLYDKWDDFNFPIVNFPFFVHVYVATLQQHMQMEYISQLIRYSFACGSHHDFLDRGLLQFYCIY